MARKKFKLKNDVPLVGYKTLPAGSVHEAVRETARYVFVEVDEGKVQVRLSRADCEEVKRGRKRQ